MWELFSRYGLATGDVCIFDNPINGGPKATDGVGMLAIPLKFWLLRFTKANFISLGWKKICVRKFNSPVAVVPADCAGNGRKDIIICHDYGATLLDCNPAGGNISWLENPGRGPKGKIAVDWKIRYIGRWPAMHRLRAGYFTQK